MSTSKPAIKVQVKQVYGKPTLYPACEKAKIFTKLSRNKTLSMADATLIKKLGFDIEQVMPEKIF